MKKHKANPAKELYKQMRLLTCDQLWDEEVMRFDRATPRERTERVAVVRAVGVVFSETGSEEQKEKARAWLRRLLHDPCEKIRRYAMAAMPKLGAGPGEEAEILGLLRATGINREKKFLSQTLEKIAGIATLRQIEAGGFDLQTTQKVNARVARSQSPGAISMNSLLSDFKGLRIHLRGRKGLETIVRDEVNETPAMRGKFRVAEVSGGLVSITPLAPFTIAGIYTLRCFGAVGFVLGNVTGHSESIGQWASLITSPLSQNIFKTFTTGSIRYRLNFVAKGHQRGAVRLVANQAFAACPQILNDARGAPWEISIYPTKQGSYLELSPNLTPDPRLYFRVHDIPAASHPPLAACMARLGGKLNNEIIWDPFCGSGLELIERALLGGVRAVLGTDVSAAAIEIARKNWTAAKIESVQATFTRCDFRDFQQIEALGPETVGLIITNPPMGRRVPVPDLRALIEDLLSVAAIVLKPGGKLIFPNPVRMETSPRSLKLQSRRIVDLGGFQCRLEEYQKLAAPPNPRRTKV
jgi:23S rRNA G2445 N2-methylase RlmL